MRRRPTGKERFHEPFTNEEASDTFFLRGLLETVRHARILHGDFVLGRNETYQLRVKSEETRSKDKSASSDLAKAKNHD